MKVKGTAIKFMPQFIMDKFGETRYNQWLDSLPPNSKTIYNNSILATTWYPLKDSFSIPIAKICELFYGNNPRGAWESGRYSADFGLRGVYKVLVKLGSPEALAKKAGNVIQKYYDNSSIECVEAEKNHAVLRVVRFSEWDKYIENRIGGYMERAIEISGGRTPKVTVTASMTRGSSYTEYDVKWS